MNGITNEKNRYPIQNTCFVLHKNSLKQKTKTAKRLPLLISGYAEFAPFLR